MRYIPFALCITALVVSGCGSSSSEPDIGAATQATDLEPPFTPVVVDLSQAGITEISDNSGDVSLAAALPATPIAETVAVEEPETPITETVAEEEPETPIAETVAVEESATVSSESPTTDAATEDSVTEPSINTYFVGLECDGCTVGEIKLNWDTDTSEIETLELYSLSGNDRIRLATFGPSDHSTDLAITNTVDFEQTDGACFEIISTYNDGTEETSPESCFELL